MPAALALLAAFGAAVALPAQRYFIFAMSTAAFTIDVPFMWPRPGERSRATRPPSR